MTTRGAWQVAYVVYENADIIKNLYDHIWQVSILDFATRIQPTDINEAQHKHRNAFGLKLTNLPRNYTHAMLDAILKDAAASSCFIPKDRNYNPRRYAYVHFHTQQQMHNAIKKQFSIKKVPLYWIEQEKPHC